MTGTDWFIIIIPVGLALLALAVAWGSTLTRQKSMREDIDEIETNLKEEYLTEKEHSLLCKNNTLELKNHVTDVVNAMGDTLVTKIEAIINGEK
jgi:hypothetical protein